MSSTRLIVMCHNFAQVQRTMRQLAQNRDVIVSKQRITDARMHLHSPLGEHDCELFFCTWEQADTNLRGIEATEAIDIASARLVNMRWKDMRKTQTLIRSRCHRYPDRDTIVPAVFHQVVKEANL